MCMGLPPELASVNLLALPDVPMLVTKILYFQNLNKSIYSKQTRMLYNGPNHTSRTRY